MSNVFYVLNALETNEGHKHSRTIFYSVYISGNIIFEMYDDDVQAPLEICPYVNTRIDAAP